MPKKPESKLGPAIPVKFELLCSLLGKQADDPAVVALIAKAGKCKVDSDYIVAKEAGFDFALGQVPGSKKKVLQGLWLFGDGVDGHRYFVGLPEGFAFTTRAALLASAPAPHTSWNREDGDVPVTHAKVTRDSWTIDGFEIASSYTKEGEVRHFYIKPPEELTGGRDLSTHPLHFETKPADAPKDAELVGMALLAAWALEQHGLPAKHAASPLAKQLVDRKITPRAFLIEACNKTLTTLDVDPKLSGFLYGYTHRLHRKQEARATADSKITELLGLERPDERYFVDDFLSTFAVLDSSFHVPDSWEAVDRITPVLDARWADFQATSFKTEPDTKLYAKAVKARDAKQVTPDRASGGVTTADAALAEDLVALIGKPLKDKTVKAVLTRAGMPVGKTIDQQANPALGVAYMGTKFEIEGKRQLGVDAVYFYAAGQEAYIRGIGAKVKFSGYPGPLPSGLMLGDSRAAVAKKLGKPTKTYENHDYWQPSKERRMSLEFDGGKLVQLYIGQPKDY
jgi:hypothetical protein